MHQNTNCRFMLFYSNFNPESLRVKIALNEAVKQIFYILPIEVHEVDFDRDKKLCRRYNISGLPTVLIFRKRHLLGRYYGELDSNDFENIIQDVLRNSN